MSFTKVVTEEIVKETRTWTYSKVEQIKFADTMWDLRLSEKLMTLRFL